LLIKVVVELILQTKCRWFTVTYKQVFMNYLVLGNVPSHPPKCSYN